MKINWENIYAKIGEGAEDYGERFEVLDCAAHNGDLIDLDWMMHLESLIGIPVSFELYTHIDKHYDGSLMELETQDIPAIVWLINDYVMNGPIKENIWKNYVFDTYKDEYGFCGWHKRVLNGLKGE